MDYEEIEYDNHGQYITDIVGIIKRNPENKKMSFFIETIMQTNKHEYILLCNALYKFITPQGGGAMTQEERARKRGIDQGEAKAKEAQEKEAKKEAKEKARAESNQASELLQTPANQSSVTASQPESPTAKRLIEKLNQIKFPIKIPRKNKLLIDEQFRLIEDKYKYYLSFYIIDAINNITVSSSDD